MGAGRPVVAQGGGGEGEISFGPDVCLVGPKMVIRSKSTKRKNMQAELWGRDVRLPRGRKEGQIDERRCGSWREKYSGHSIKEGDGASC